MKYLLIILLVSFASIQAFAQERGVELSYTNSLFDTRNGPEIIPGPEEIFPSFNIGIHLELEFKLNVDYIHQIGEKNELLIGGGLNFWTYEKFVHNNATKPPIIIIENINEQILSNLFQFNIGLRYQLFAFKKYNIFLQNKLIFGIGNAFEIRYIHFGIQPALGVEHQLNENHNLFFTVNYTKYFSRAFEGKELPNPQSFGLSVGIAKQL